MKLRLEGSLLYLPVRFGWAGQSLELSRVLLDTGAASTLLKSEWAEQLGIRPQDHGPLRSMYGIGGRELAYTVTLETLQVGEQARVNFPVQVSAMNYLLDIDAILGLDALLALGAVLDFSTLELSLSSP